MIRTIYLVLVPLILLGMGGIFLHIRNHRSIVGSLTFMLLIVLCAWWLGFSGIEMLSMNPDLKILLAKIYFPAITFVPVIWFQFTMLYASHWHKSNHAGIALLSIIPTISTLLCWTNELHHALWSDIFFSPIDSIFMMRVLFGPWFWIHSIYSYLLILIGMIIIITAGNYPSRFYRHQIAVIILGVLVPVTVNVIYVFFSNPFTHIDFTPLSFSAAIFLIGFGIFRFELFSSYPIARTTAFDEMEDGFILLDRDGYIIDFNASAEKVFEHTLKSSMDERFDQLFPGVLPEKKPGEDTHTETETELNIAGMWYAMRTHSILDRNSKRRGTALFFRNVSTRHHAQEALEKSEEKFRSLVEQSRDGIILVDEAQAIVEWNRAMTSITGIPAEEALGKQITEVIMDILLDDVRKNFFMKIQEGASWALNESTPTYHIQNQEFTIITRNLERRIVQVSFFPVQFGEKYGRGAILRDITENKQREQQLVMAQHMAGLGTLAAGAAHEINSPLQVVCGLSDRLLRWKTASQEPDPTREDLEMLNRNAWRIGEIVHSLLKYAESNPGEFGSYDLNRIVQETAMLFKSQFENNPDLIFLLYLAPDMPEIMADRSMISEALVHLIKNALASIPGKGAIAVHTTYDEATSRFLLDIVDNGVGIPEEIQSRIFDPFFSTRPFGEGNGLGLSVVAGIIRAHNGEIMVESTPETGTRVHIELPQHPPTQNYALSASSSLGRLG